MFKIKFDILEMEIAYTFTSTISSSCFLFYNSSYIFLILDGKKKIKNQNYISHIVFNLRRNS